MLNAPCIEEQNTQLGGLNTLSSPHTHTFYLVNLSCSLPEPLQVRSRVFQIHSLHRRRTRRTKTSDLGRKLLNRPSFLIIPGFAPRCLNLPECFFRQPTVHSLNASSFPYLAVYSDSASLTVTSHRNNKPTSALVLVPFRFFPFLSPRKNVHVHVHLPYPDAWSSRVTASP